MKRSKQKLPKVKENEVLRAVMDYLGYQKGLLFWRNNTGALVSEKRFIRFGVVGSPDIYVLKQGILYGLEIKGSGGKLSDEQLRFADRFKMVGGKYELIYDVDDVEQALKRV